MVTMTLREASERATRSSSVHGGESVSRNITSHKEKGIGAWSDAEIKRAITQGVRMDGTRLKPPMGFAWYARMNDEDLSAIETASSHIKLAGARYPEFHEKLVGL